MLLCLTLLAVQLGGVDVILCDTGGHDALLGMVIQTAAALAALILGAALTKGSAVGTGDTDKGFLTAFELFHIGGLVVVPTVIADIIGIAFFIVIILGETGFKDALEGGQIHGVGVEDFFIDFFPDIPGMGDGDTVGIGFGILAALFLAQDIGRHPTIETVLMSILSLGIELVDTAA